MRRSLTTSGIRERSSKYRAGIDLFRRSVFSAFVGLSTTGVDTGFLANRFSVVESRFQPGVLALLDFIDIKISSPVKSCNIWFLWRPYVTQGLKTRCLLLSRYLARGPNRKEGFLSLQFFDSASVREFAINCKVVTRF